MAWLQALLAGAFKSRTIWVNVLALTVQVLGHASGVLPPEWAPYITAALAVLNLVLRFLTTTPLVPGPTPTPDPNVPTPDPSPAEPLLDLVRKVIEAIIAKKLPATEAKPLLLAKVAAAVDEAETFDQSEVSDLLKELKA